MPAGLRARNPLAAQKKLHTETLPAPIISQIELGKVGKATLQRVAAAVL
jgi:hypothetical protein